MNSRKTIFYITQAHEKKFHTKLITPDTVSNDIDEFYRNLEFDANFKLNKTTHSVNIYAPT